MPIYTKPPATISALDDFGHDLIGSGLALGAAAEEALLFSPTASIIAAGELATAEAGEPLGLAPRTGGLRFRQVPKLSAEALNEQFGIEGHLTFTEPETEEYGRIKNRNARAEQAREDVFRRADKGFLAGAARFGVGLAASALDPLNIASAFIPAAGPARFALASAGFARPAAFLGTKTLSARLATGAIEGTVGAAIVEPLVVAGARARGSDYDEYDSFLNLVFGGVLGGGLHAGLGKLGDVLDARRTVPDVVAAAPAEAREALTRTAVAQAAQGEVVEVGPIFERVLADEDAAARASAAPPPVAAEGLQAQFNPGFAARFSTTATTPAGRKVGIEYAVVEARSLITSQTDDLAVNPAFPQALQPRDRTRSVSALQINAIAAKLDPELLAASARAGDGAPIIGPDGVVESGNGRTLAIRRAYALGLDGAKRYRAYLEELGFKLDGFREPVLVRIRQGELSPQERAAFVLEANERDTAAFSATERAQSDARQITDEQIELYRGGDVTSAANRPFVRAFLRDVASPTEHGALVAKDETLSLEGQRRIQAALLARAYDDADLIAALTEVTDNDIRALGGALVDASGFWAQLRADARSGAIDAELDVTPQLLEAVKLVRQAREGGRNVKEFVKQDDFFSGAIDQRTEHFLRLFFRDEDFSKPRSRANVADVLAYYTQEARKSQAGPGLFGDKTSPEAILKQARSRLDGGLFQEPAGAASLLPVDARALPGRQADGGSRSGRGSRLSVEARQAGEAEGGAGPLRLPEPIDGAADPAASLRIAQEIEQAPDTLRPEDAEEALRDTLNELADQDQQAPLDAESKALLKAADDEIKAAKDYGEVVRAAAVCMKRRGL